MDACSVQSRHQADAALHYAKGKNTSDIALIIDAMDFLHSQKVDAFCIVASDSDYIGLATRIRESGLAVYGFGTRQAPHAFRAACDEFVLTDEREMTFVEIKAPEVVAHGDHLMAANTPAAKPAPGECGSWLHRA